MTTQHKLMTVPKGILTQGPMEELLRTMTTQQDSIGL